LRLDDEDEEDNEPRPAYQYVTTATNLISRLEVLGYTLNKVKDEFEKGKVRAIEESKLWEAKGYFKAIDDGIEKFWITPPFATSKILKQFYSGYTFEVWNQLIKKVIARKLRSVYNLQNETSREKRLKKQNIHLYHILEARGHDNGFKFGFPSENPYYLYRGLLEAVKPETPVILDFSSLVNWIEAEEYLCEPPKTVILTEGSSDKRILQESLKILYPHLYDYYSFIDFDLANMPGSAGHLVNIVKAFVATGVERKTIAIFDNDTAGHDAMRQLVNVPLPEHMRILSLPNLEFAKKYPTIGPQGQIEIDINGLACSIELYLGQNMLLDENNNFLPIQWGGYMQGAKKYQGEIINKITIQNRYLKLLSRIEANPNLSKTYDWSGMHSIFQAIFNAFNN